MEIYIKKLKIWIYKGNKDMNIKDKDKSKMCVNIIRKINLRSLKKKSKINIKRAEIRNI
jgi:hypothetical protein